MFPVAEHSGFSIVAAERPVEHENSPRPGIRVLAFGIPRVWGFGNLLRSAPLFGGSLGFVPEN